MEQSSTETKAEERVSLAEAAPQGVFLRLWGSQGSEEGEFFDPSRMCVSGEEVFVCDYDNDRIQLFETAVLSASGARKAAGKGSYVVRVI